MPADFYLSEAFSRITATADPAQFRDAADKAIKGLAGLNPTVSVQLGSDKAKGDAEELKLRLKEIFNGITEKIDLNDKDAQLAFARLSLSADRLQHKLSNEKITLDGVDRARVDLLSLDVAADRLQKKFGAMDLGGTSSLYSRTKTWSGLFKTLTGTGGAGAGGAATSTGTAAGDAGASGLAAIFSNPYSATAVVSAALAALPMVAQVAAGGIVAALGGGLAAVAIYGSKDSKLVGRSFTDLETTALGALKQISQPFHQVIADILNAATSSIPSLFGAMGTAIQAIAGPFDRVGVAIAKGFGSPAVATSIKAVGASFAALLTALAPQIPGDITAIATGITRMANVIKDNPKPFADFVWFLVRVVSVAFDTIAALTSVATYMETHFVPAVRDAGKIWDAVWADSIGAVIRFEQADATVMANMRRTIATVFDGIRHDVSAAWDSLWAQTVSSTVHGIDDVITWFRGMPARAISAVTGLGHDLASFASQAMSEMGTGFRDEFSSLIHWFESVPGKILHALGIHSPPSWAIDAGKHIIAGLHIGLGHGLGSLIGFSANVADQLAAGLSGAGIGLSGVANSSGYAALKSAAAKKGWTGGLWQDLYNVEMAEAGFNLTARNPSSGAYGMAQFINGPAEYGSYGGNATTAAGQAVGMVNYIAQRYGNPAAAWAHEEAYHWYGKGSASAMPGLAIVGELGPELINLRGGETITPLPAAKRVSSSAAGSVAPVTVEMTWKGGPTGAIDRALWLWLQRSVAVKGGGDVQSALGRKN